MRMINGHDVLPPIPGSTVFKNPVQIQELVTHNADVAVRHYKQGQLVIVTVLYGARNYGTALETAIEEHPDSGDLILLPDIMEVRRTDDTTSLDKEPVIIRDLNRDIEGKHVLVVEDLIDHGRSLKLIAETLLARNPASFAISPLTIKVGCQMVDITQWLFGSWFEYTDGHWLYGFGPDVLGRHRNFPAICGIEETKIPASYLPKPKDKDAIAIVAA